MSQSTTSTGKSNPLSRSRTTFLECLVNCNSSTKNRGGFSQINAFRNTSNVSCLANTILLKGPVDGVSAQQGVRTIRFEGLETEFAISAGPVEPFYSYVVA